MLSRDHVRLEKFVELLSRWLQPPNLVGMHTRMREPVSRKDFLQASGNPVRKRKTFKIKVVILKSATLLSENFAGRTFHDSGLSRNFLDFAGISFRESRKIMHFAGI